MESKNITAGGIKMRWLESGEGPASVVFVHGIPTGPLLWRHVVPLVRDARCFSWEMVGYGDSMPEGIDRDISVGKQADYLLAWMDAVGLSSAVLAGHDLGGGVVQIAATRRPAACSGLFLTNAIGYDSWPIPSVKMMQMTGGVMRHLPNAIFRGIYSSFIHRGHEDAGRASEAVHCHWPSYARHGGATAFVRQVRSLDVKDTLAVSNSLSTLTVPARVVWGVDDQFQKAEYGERLARDLKTSLTRIEGGKHFTPEDHPDVIAREVSGLVQEVASSA